MDILKQSGVYEIRNSVNGKRYVGSAISLSRRHSQHWNKLRAGKHHSRHLQAAWNKYGSDTFEFKPLLVCARDDLLMYEQRCIDGYKPEYNIAPVAGSTLGIPCGEEKRRKIAVAHTGKTLTPEHKAAIAAGGMGRRPTEAARANMRAAQQARVALDPVAFSAAASARLRNRVCTAEQRAKISAARKGQSVAWSPERLEQHRQRTIQSNKTRIFSPETREKMAAAKRGHTKSPETLQKMSDVMKGNTHLLGKKHSAETRAKMSASHRARKEVLRAN